MPMYLYGSIPGLPGTAVARWRLSRTLASTFVVISLALAARASAQTLMVATEGDPLVPSFFTLDFGDGLGPTTGGITSTNYTLAINAVEGTARFASYHQDVDPLILPGGFSTGNLIIEVVPGSSSGTYDPETGIFNTSEMYAIFFDGDLSPFGIESPVILPSTSTGFVTSFPGGFGKIAMNWVGSSSLPNPFDPNNPLVFTYVCTVNTVFAPRVGQVDPVGLLDRALPVPGRDRSLTSGLPTIIESNPAPFSRQDTLNDKLNQRANRGAHRIR